jgi:hypothetical protein
MGGVDKKGIWATQAGGVIGGFSLGWAFGVGSFALPSRGEGLEEIADALMAAALGGWIGAVLGASVLLTILKAGYVKRTAAWLALFVPLIFGPGLVLSIVWEDEEQFGSTVYSFLFLYACVFLTAYLARRLGTRDSAGEGSSQAPGQRKL